jgi:hypothetical protein
VLGIPKQDAKKQNLSEFTAILMLVGLLFFASLSAMTVHLSSVLAS